SLAVFARSYRDRDVVAGFIRTGAGELYELRNIAPGVHVFRQLDPDSYPNGAAPIAASVTQAAAAPALCVGDTEVVNLGVYYTPAARDAQGGDEQITTLIGEAASATNASYFYSGIKTRVVVAKWSVVDYAEGASGGDDLAALANPSDGKMDILQYERDMNDLDVIVLISERKDLCGIAKLMTEVTTNFAPYAFG